MSAQVLQDIMQHGHDTQVFQQTLLAKIVIERLVDDQQLGVVRDEPEVEQVLAVLSQHATRPITQVPTSYRQCIVSLHVHV